MTPFLKKMFSLFISNDLVLHFHKGTDTETNITEMDLKKSDVGTEVC